ncbi:patatin [Rhodobacteraceae bacterium 63075]|nr:patatin [Rhodobacteraceae bacterium 63075]
MKLGLALGSGGARGWCHIGALLELDEMDLRPDVVAGCSMGALVGAAYAGGCLDALEEWARGLTRQSVMRLLDIRLSGGGLVQGAAITQVLGEIGVPERIEDLERRFLAVATDMESGREVWLQEGSVAETVRASIAIPGVFAPHWHGGRWLLDGGLVNPVPTTACRALGADVVIAVNPNGPHGDRLWYPPEPEESIWPGLLEGQSGVSLPEPIQNWLKPKDRRDKPAAPDYFDVVSTSIDIMTEYLRKTRAAGDPAHVALDADLRQEILVLELEKAAPAIDEGRRIVREKRDEILRVCEAGGLP